MICQQDAPMRVAKQAIFIAIFIANKPLAPPCHPVKENTWAMVNMDQMQASMNATQVKDGSCLSASDLDDSAEAIFLMA